MAFKVAKPFSTPRRRFAVGQSVTPEDIDGPASFDHWMDRGFIVEEKTKSAAKTPATESPSAD